MSGLLPCPFCSGEAKRIDIEAREDVENAGASFITCTKCDASTALHFDRKENLIGSWNNRSYLKRDSLARHLAALDGIRLPEVRSTVMQVADATNWREYLGRADDLLSWISLDMDTEAVR